MRINTRFPVAVHILTLIALKNEAISSEIIAKSVNTNPVVIRRINAMLKKANLVNVNAGIGGTVLSRSPENITLLDIYNAVKSSSDAMLFDLHETPNPKCPVGANIHEVLSDSMMSAQQALENDLAQQTLWDVAKSIAEKAQIPIG